MIIFLFPFSPSLSPFCSANSSGRQQWDVDSHPPVSTSARSAAPSAVYICCITSYCACTRVLRRAPPFGRGWGRKNVFWRGGRRAPAYLLRAAGRGPPHALAQGKGKFSDAPGGRVAAAAAELLSRAVAISEPSSVSEKASPHPPKARALVLFLASPRPQPLSLAFLPSAGRALLLPCGPRAPAAFLASSHRLRGVSW